MIFWPHISWGPWRGFAFCRSIYSISIRWLLDHSNPSTLKHLQGFLWETQARQTWKSSQKLSATLWADVNLEQNAVVHHNGILQIPMQTVGYSNKIWPKAPARCRARELAHPPTKIIGSTGNGIYSYGQWPSFLDENYLFLLVFESHVTDSRRLHPAKSIVSIYTISINSWIQ